MIEVADRKGIPTIIGTEKREASFVISSKVKNDKSPEVVVKVADRKGIPMPIGTEKREASFVIRLVGRSLK